MLTWWLRGMEAISRNWRFGEKGPLLEAPDEPALPHMDSGAPVHYGPSGSQDYTAIMCCFRLLVLR